MDEGYTKSCNHVAAMEIQKKQTIPKSLPLRSNSNADNEEMLLKFDVLIASEHASLAKHCNFHCCFQMTSPRRVFYEKDIVLG